MIDRDAFNNRATSGDVQEVTEAIQRLTRVVHGLSVNTFVLGVTMAGDEYVKAVKEARTLAGLDSGEDD